MRESDERGGDARRDETEHERLDRNLEELTGELRVVVTGVQVLFAFLLIVPFNSGFEGIGPFERAVYIVTLLWPRSPPCARSPRPPSTAGSSATTTSAISSSPRTAS